MGFSLADQTKARLRKFTNAFVIGTAGVSPIGSHSQESDLSSAVTLTPPANARVLFFQPLSQNIRVTVEGTTPTASLGVQYPFGGLYRIDLAEGTTVKMIQESATASLEYWWGV
jgi:hypothetical protein